MDLGRILRGFWEVLGLPEGSKKGEKAPPEASCKSNSTFSRSWEAFGRVWGGFWEAFGWVWEAFGGLLGPLGAIFGVIFGCLYAGGSSKGLLEASGVDFGSILGGLGWSGEGV